MGAYLTFDCTKPSDRPGRQTIAVIVCESVVGRCFIATLVTAFCFSFIFPNKAYSVPNENNGRMQSGGIALTLGTPGALNLNISRLATKKWGWALAGGYVPGRYDNHWGGFQVGTFYMLGRSSRHYSALCMHVGYFECEVSDDGVHAAFAGYGVLYKWRFLYAQLDINLGKWEEVWSNPQLGAQVGIVLKTFHSGQQ